MNSDGVESQFLSLSREDWAGLKADCSIPITDAELQESQGLLDVVSRDVVEDVYFPLARLINLHYVAHRNLKSLTQQFLNLPANPSPFIIGIAGSVAVGKSSASRLLRLLLSRWSEHPSVYLVTTDGFLYDNATLSERDLMRRKGFPESYDTQALLNFVRELASGNPRVYAPVYSHVSYDIVPESNIEIKDPDIVLIEGLNVLQQPHRDHNWSGTILSSYFDFSIFIDASELDIKQWYVERFLTLRETAFSNPDSFFHHFKSLTDSEAINMAEQIWESINALNLRENILPTRENANVILHKDSNHSINRIFLRK